MRCVYLIIRILLLILLSSAEPMINAKNIYRLKMILNLDKIPEMPKSFVCRNIQLF